MKTKLISVLVVIMILLSACGHIDYTLSWQEQYDLGVRYLSEGNYEEAIIAFTAAIEIDPKRAPAYVGRGDTYVSMGDEAHNASEAYELYLKALDDYEQAVELGSQDTELKLKRLRETVQGLQVNAEAEPLLKELYTLLNANDIEAAKNLMRKEDYQEMSIVATEGCLTYTEDDDLYLVAYGDSYYYFGQWRSGQRSGHGLWIKAVFGDDSSMESELYDGMWSEDLPNGEGKVTKKWDEAKIQAEAAVSVEDVGSFKNGLYDGVISKTVHFNNGSSYVYAPITAVEGVYQPISEIPTDIPEKEQERIRARIRLREQETEGKQYIVALDQLNRTGAISDLCDSGSVHSVFGMS